MTCDFWAENANNKEQQKQRLSGYRTVYIPSIAKCAVDGYPGMFGRRRKQTKASAERAGLAGMEGGKKRISPRPRSQNRERLRSK